MKLHAKFTLRNYLDKEGLQNIVYMIILNGENIPQYTEFKTHSKYWDAKEQRLKGGHVLSNDINIQLDTIVQNFSKFITLCKVQNIDIDKFTIRNFFTNKKVTPSKDFLFFCQDNIDKYGKTNLKKSSLYVHNSCLASLKSFAPSISFDDVNVEFLMDYEKHLKGLNNDVNTIHKKIKFIRTYINKAITLGIYDKYVFRNFKIKTKSSKPNFLSLEDFNKLVAYYFETQSSLHKKHLQYFLFACCTGLRYSDLRKLKWADITEKSIYIRMEKTENVITIPMNKKIKSFLPLVRTESFVFDLPTNQVGNKFLKLIATAAKVEKILTFHVARHTFATLSLNYGISLHSVQKLLGHKRSETTEIYAKLSNKTLENEMLKWD